MQPSIARTTTTLLSLREEETFIWVNLEASSSLIGVLFEKLRRESYEFEVTCLQVLKKEVDGELLEPVELVQIQIHQDLNAKVVDRILARNGMIMDIDQGEDDTQM